MGSEMCWIRLYKHLNTVRFNLNINSFRHPQLAQPVKFIYHVQTELIHMTADRIALILSRTARIQNTNFRILSKEREWMYI
jgi:hypothetical protein